EFSEGYRGITAYADEAVRAFGDLAPEIQAAAAAEMALQTQSAETFNEIITGGETAADVMSNLDEVTQKAVDGIAKGFASFADTGNLIKLTQQFAGIEGAEDPAAAAAEYEAAWT